MVAATIRTIFAQPSAARVREQLQVIMGMLGRQLPKVEAMLLDAAEDVTAFAAFPLGYWKKTGAPTIWLHTAPHVDDPVPGVAVGGVVPSGTEDGTGV
jgi:hypothetical protein